MPRTKTVEDTQVETNQDSATSEVKKKSTSKTKDNSNEKILALETQLAEMKELINNLTNQQNTVETINTTSISEEYIPIVSHTVGELTLSTLGHGQGTLYSIPKFGDIIDIPFSDLKSIVLNNRRITENGRYYILNKQAVKQLRLERVYDKLLSNEDIMDLFNMESKVVIELFDSCTDRQKEMISDLVEDRILNGQYVQGDLIYHIEKTLGKKLTDE